MKAVSLFCGAGGMDVGVQNAGFEIVAANELDPYACKTYRENHKETILYEGDIEKNLDAIGTHKGIDLVIGGHRAKVFQLLVEWIRMIHAQNWCSHIVTLLNESCLKLL